MSILTASLSPNNIPLCPACGVESVLVRVPGEPHGIRRFPSHEAAKLTTLAGWFEKHRATVQ